MCSITWHYWLKAVLALSENAFFSSLLLFPNQTHLFPKLPSHFSPKLSKYCSEKPILLQWKGHTLKAAACFMTHPKL